MSAAMVYCHCSTAYNLFLGILSLCEVTNESFSRSVVATFKKSAPARGALRKNDVNDSTGELPVPAWNAFLLVPLKFLVERDSLAENSAFCKH